jgi:predicted SAM-dependent methyltransferase
MFHIRRIIWPLKRPAFPKNADGKVYLHVGSGHFNDNRFINLDIQPFNTVHYLTDGKSINIDSSSVDLIYASHVLEHFSHKVTSSVLSEWRRLLKTGGEIFISVPDYKKLSSIYTISGDIDKVKIFIMGSQSNPFDFHKNIFDISSMTDILEQAGFSNISSWNEEDYSKYAFDDYAHYGPTRTISINLKARKI